MSFVTVHTTRRVADSLQAERSRHANEHGEVRWIPMDEGQAKEFLD